MKAGLIFGLARLFGLRSRPAAEAALLLAGAGEFAFVILGQAMGGGIVDRTTGETVLVAATVSMFCIPLLSLLSVRVGGRKVAPAETPAEPEGAEPGGAEPGGTPRVLVVGYGRVGRLVGDMLNRHQVAWVGAEKDARMVDTGRRAAVGGDAAGSSAGSYALPHSPQLRSAPSTSSSTSTPSPVSSSCATARSRCVASP